MEQTRLPATSRTDAVGTIQFRGEKTENESRKTRGRDREVTRRDTFQ